MTIATVHRVFTATAPSNIALIKYMGKVEGDSSVRNRPTNTSLSYTLPHLLSFVQLEFDSSLKADQWSALTEYGDVRFQPMHLSEKGKARFLAHLAMIRSELKFDGFFHVRSANDFPSDCGLASSASSFAALTKVASVAISELQEKEIPTVQQMANWSRLGSGSSCRSFFEPWSVWTPASVADVPVLSALGEFIHQVVVVNSEVKTVSSSEAHKRVTSSALFKGRPERADARVHSFVEALKADRWQLAFEIAWQEFWDMHALFETSEPPFGYMTSGTLEVLSFVREKIWTDGNDGPLVTMDAGPNVHLLYKANARGREHAATLAAFAKGRFQVFSSHSDFSSSESTR